MLHRHPFLSLLTGAYLVFVGWLTLSPQRDIGSEGDLLVRILEAAHRRGYVEGLDYDRVEFLANIALFVPIGVFLLLLFGAGGWWVAVMACVAATLGIEYAQHYIPGRVPDQRDLVANSAGGMVGVALALVLTWPATARRRRRRRARAARA